MLMRIASQSKVEEEDWRSSRRCTTVHGCGDARSRDACLLGLDEIGLWMCERRGEEEEEEYGDATSMGM